MRTIAPARCRSDVAHERRLLAAGGTPGRALSGTDPALGDLVAGGCPVLLLEPADAFTVVEPDTGRTREMQAEILVRQGFHRLPSGAGLPPRLDGWSVRRQGTQLHVRDERDDLWAYTSVRPGQTWLGAAARYGMVLVVYGALVGVRAPRGVRATQYGARQRAAELRAGLARGFVAAAMLDWRH
jgi:hypothetical protein